MMPVDLKTDYSCFTNNELWKANKQEKRTMKVLMLGLAAMVFVWVVQAQANVIAWHEDISKETLNSLTIKY